MNLNNRSISVNIEIRKRLSTDHRKSESKEYLNANHVKKKEITMPFIETMGNMFD